MLFRSRNTLQVLPHLRSRAFETRQAAAAALSHISRAVGVWDPSSTAPSSTDDAAPPPASSESASLDLTTFNLRKILAEGSLLLSSSGTEYAKLSNLSAEELARAQQDALKKLGLGMGAAGGGTEDELGLDMGAELAAGAQPLESVPPLESLPRPTCPLALPPPKFKVEPGTSLRQIGRAHV